MTALTARATTAATNTTAGLHELQRRMARAVMHPLTRAETMVHRRRDGVRNDEDAAVFIKPNDRLSSFDRLEIYNRQYWFRLYSSFEEDFPGLAAIVGRRRFEGLMRAYLTDHPSSSFTLRNLGSRLEAWLVAHPEWIEPRAQLAMDMVRLEWMHIEAFDAAALPVLGADDLAGVTESTRFRLQPYLRLLRLSYPVDDLLIAVRNAGGSGDASSNNAVAARRSRKVRRVADLAVEEIFLGVHRMENSIYYRRLEREEHAMLTALMEGQTLGEAVEAGFATSPLGEEDRAALVERVFANWALLGWFAAPDSFAASDGESECG
jgi:hypothetical protein